MYIYFFAIFILINIFINSAHALHIIILFYIFNNYCPVCFSMKKIQIHRFYVVIMDKKQQHVSRKLCSLSFCFIYVISNYMQGNLIISILCNRIIIQKENNNQYMYLSQLYIHEYMHIVCCTNKMHKIPAMLLQVQGQGMLMVKRET